MKGNFLHLPTVFIALSAVPGFAQAQERWEPVSGKPTIERRGGTNRSLLKRREGAEAVASAMCGVLSGTTARPVLIGPGYRLVFDEPGICVEG